MSVSDMLTLIYLLFYLNTNQCLYLNQSINSISHSNRQADNHIKYSLYNYGKRSNHTLNSKNRPFIVRNNLNNFSTKYLIISSAIIIPGSIYRIVVNILESTETINLNAIISSTTKGLEISSERLELSSQTSEIIQIKVRSN